MNSSLKKIITSQLQISSDQEAQRFCKYFFDLYRIELFKDGLDLILTKLREKKLRFEIKEMQGWDTNVGCFLTEQKSFYDKAFGRFFTKASPKIILRKLSYNVLAHEMAHALEFESGLNLGVEFRQAVGYDMKDRQPSIFTLKGEVKRLMVDALKAYPPEQFLSELFARYFELLSISRNVCANGDFATSDVMNFFANVTNFIEKIFNPQIKSQIAEDIAGITNEIVRQVRLEAPRKSFEEKIDSRAGKSFSSSIKSNAGWQNSWNKYKEIEDKG